MKVCVITGEASGDLHAARLVRELRNREPGLEVFGTGGDALEREGASLLAHVRELGIVGLVNVLRHVPFFIRLRDRIVEQVVARKPDAVVLVDFPDFNLRVAKRLRDTRIPIIYYISPQVWAWRRGRVRKIARLVDHMIVIFPFEESFYRERGVPVTYVGHPLVEQVEESNGDPARTRTTIALLPGSRAREVEDLLPSMLAAVKLLRSGRDLDAFVVRASTIDREVMVRMIGDAGVQIVDGGIEAVRNAHVALVSSGTATLECAIRGVPVVVMYRLSRLTYLLARRLVRIPYFSLINIVAERGVVPELMQDEVTPARIAREAEQLLTEPERSETLEALLDVRRRLGEPGAASRAADVVMSVVAERSATMEAS